MMFTLGLLVGITLCIFNAILYKRTEVAVVRKIKQLQSAAAPKGSIIEPDGEELQDWVDSLKS